MEKLSIQSTKPRLGADCGSDHELLIAKFRLKLKKVGKTTRPSSLVQFSSVTQLCLTLCDPLDSSPDSIDHQMVNTKIRLTIFFAAREGDDLYSQHK